jgi:hypothetical protein
MNKIIGIFLTLCLAGSLYGQKSKTLNWSDFEFAGFKKVETEFYGMKDNIDWPIFSSYIQSFEGEKIKLEGYVMCMQTYPDYGDTNSVKICLLTISKEPTIEICGVKQFEQNEFAKIESNSELTEGSKVTFEGILYLNQNGGDGSLIEIRKGKAIKQN